jgi:hypothetical protein
MLSKIPGRRIKEDGRKVQAFSLAQSAQRRRREDAERSEGDAAIQGLRGVQPILEENFAPSLAYDPLDCSASQ